MAFRAGAARRNRWERWQHIAAIEAERFRPILILAQWFAVLTSIPGLSAITAFVLLAKRPSSAPSNLGRPQVSQALRPWRDSPAAGPVAPSSAAAEPNPPGLLHARPRRGPFQSGYQGQGQATHRRRKAGQGRSHRRHAKAERPTSQRPLEGQSKLDPKIRSIKTDALKQ
jgi:hypothetical protein